MTAIQSIMYEPLPITLELLQKALDSMSKLGLSPYFAESEKVGKPEKAHHAIKYPDRTEYLGVPRILSYDDDSIEFVSKVLSSQKSYGDRPPELSFYTKSNLKNFRHTVRFYTRPDGIHTILNYVATQGGDRAPTARVLLELSKQLFEIFKPIYTSIDFQYKSDPQSIKKSLQTRRIQELYWANLFALEYVRTYGREFFLNAPVWKVEELSNGGILIQLSAEISPASEKAINVEKIARYFQEAGLKSISWPTNRYFRFPKV